VFGFFWWFFHRTDLWDLAVGVVYFTCGRVDQLYLFS
jgi:hypothetical protein